MVERLLSAQGLMKPRVFLKSASTDASSNSGVFDDDPDAPAETPDPTDPPTVAPGLVQFLYVMKWFSKNSKKFRISTYIKL